MTAGRPPGPAYRTSCAHFHKALPRKCDTYRLQVTPPPASPLWLRLQAEVEGPLALLRVATSVNAELLGRDDLGRIGSGAVADLLVLDGDPLRDPSVLRGDPDRRAVFQGGIRVAEHDARLVLLMSGQRRVWRRIAGMAG